MLILEILDGRKGPKRQKARLEIADRALVLALGFRASLLQDDRLEAQLPEARGDLVVQHRVLARALGHDRRVVVEHATLGDATKAAERSEERGHEVAYRLGEGEHGLMRRRVRQGRHQAARLSEAVLSDRDLDGDIPPVEVANLAGDVAGALEAAPGEIAGALVFEVVLENRDATQIAAVLQALEDDGRGGLGVVLEHLGDVGLEGIEQRALGPALVARRLGKPQEAIDRVA